METETTQNQAAAVNIPAFWKAQQKDWRITVIRTSLERLGYKIILPYLTLYIVLLHRSFHRPTAGWHLAGDHAP